MLFRLLNNNKTGFGMVPGFPVYLFVQAVICGIWLIWLLSGKLFVN